MYVSMQHHTMTSGVTRPCRCCAQTVSTPFRWQSDHLVMPTFKFQLLVAGIFCQCTTNWEQSASQRCLCGTTIILPLAPHGSY